MKSRFGHLGFEPQIVRERRRRLNGAEEMDNKDNVMRIVGGALFPGAAWGTVNASWPLAVLECDEEGISVDVRRFPMRNLFRKMTKYASQKAPGDAWWSSGWGALSSARISPRSIVLVNNLREDCKFVALTGRAMRRLGLYLDERNIAVERVRNNLSYGWGRPWPPTKG